MKILLSCYSFGAGKGSEPGVGWNVASKLADRGHEVTVITTDEFAEGNRPEIEKFAGKLRVMEWPCGLTDFHLSKTYRKWQEKVAPLVQELVQNELFDVIHHVTFNQYRNILFIAKSGLPYLVGPVGGGETVPLCFFKEMPWSLRIKELLRYAMVDALPLIWRGLRSPNKGIYLASSPATLKRIGILFMLDARLSCMIAIDEREIINSPPPSPARPFLLYAGRFIPLKGANLLLTALSSLWNQGIQIQLKIVGAGSKEDQEAITRKAASLGLSPEAVEIHPFIPRDEFLAMLPEATAFVYTGFRDSGAMVVLEALAAGTIPLCFDLPGQYWLPEELSVKIPVKKGRIVEQICTGIKRCMEFPRDAAFHEKRCRFLRENMTWDRRIEDFESLYQELTNKP